MKTKVARTVSKILRSDSIGSRIFYAAVCTLLFLTAILKLGSLAGGSAGLYVKEPLLEVQMRWFLLGSSLFELTAVAGIVFSAKGLTKGAITRIAFGLIAAYRIALHVQDVKFCPCLGTFATEFLGGANGGMASAVLGGIVLSVLALNELILRCGQTTASAEDVLWKKQ